MRFIILHIVLCCNICQFTFGQSEEKKLKLLTGVSLTSFDKTHYGGIDLGVSQYNWKDSYDSLGHFTFKFTNTSVYTSVIFGKKPVMGLHYNFLRGGFLPYYLGYISIGGDLSIMTNFQKISFVIQPEVALSFGEHGKISVGPSITMGNSPFEGFNQVFATVKLQIYHHTLKKTIK